jgi:hypothetical protein
LAISPISDSNNSASLINEEYMRYTFRLASVENCTGNFETLPACRDESDAQQGCGPPDYSVSQTANVLANSAMKYCRQNQTYSMSQ